MKLVTLVRAPKDLQAASVALGKATGMAPAEARMRLAPEPPALLARLAADEADTVTASLRGQGLPVLAIEEGEVATRPRCIARTAVFEDKLGTFTTRAGDPLLLAWDDVVAVLRGASSERSGTERTEKSTSFSLGAAVITGGLKLTKTTEKTVKTSEENTEQSLFVFGRSGACAVLRESAMDFSCLGKLLQPARMANMTTLFRLLKEHTPRAFHDDRLLRLGRRPLPFVLGAESTTALSAVTTRSSTATGLEVLAEALYQAVLQGLVPGVTPGLTPG